MGGYACLTSGFAITTEMIDNALGVVTEFDGRPSSTMQEVRYDPKTGAQKTVNKRIPKIPRFRYVTITYQNTRYVNRIYAQNAHIDPKTWPDVLQIASLPANFVMQEDYVNLMEHFAATNKLRISWERYGEECTLTTDKLSCDTDFVPVSWFTAERKHEIELLRQVLERHGFKNIEFGIMPSFYE